MLMKFNYARSFPSEKDKMEQFDAFLEELTEEYSEDFATVLSKQRDFMAFGIGSNGIIYNPSPDLPPYIEKQILRKINELWYPDRL